MMIEPILIGCLIAFLILVIIAITQLSISNARQRKSDSDITSQILAINSFLKQNQVLFSEQMKLFGNHQNQWFQSFQTQLKDNGNFTLHQLQKMEDRVNLSVKDLQKDNHLQLEKMRLTVDEKLHKTLEERLGKSFSTVSKHLEAVQKGLGEMQNLATGVGDLKKVLNNVKTRGVMGEMMLGNILEQILTSEQYALNVKTVPHSSAHVEFAIKFPGNLDKEVWLPIDSKFPLDIYEHLQKAYDDGIPPEIDQAQNNLVKTVYSMAIDIKSKYISPPHTTEFAILFLPIEGLYAELARTPGLLVDLQTKHKIMLCGPSNLAAFLNSLQLGFRTIAIEKRSSEVWDVLSKLKTEIPKIGDSLQKVPKKIQQPTHSIDSVGVRTRAIERNLREVGETKSLNQKENSSY